MNGLLSVNHKLITITYEHSVVATEKHLIIIIAKCFIERLIVMQLLPLT